MLLEGVQSREILLLIGSGPDSMGKHLKLQGLNLEVEDWSHQVVAVSLVCVREFDLIQFVFNHELA